MLVAALASEAAATLIGLIVAGPCALVYWLAYVTSRPPDGYWDNHTLPRAMAWLFRERVSRARGGATLEEPLAYVLGTVIIVLTALRARKSPEMASGLSLRPRSWPHPFPGTNYLVLL